MESVVVADSTELQRLATLTGVGASMWLRNASSDCPSQSPLGGERCMLSTFLLGRGCCFGTMLSSKSTSSSELRCSGAREAGGVLELVGGACREPPRGRSVVTTRASCAIARATEVTGQSKEE